jgi:hypothetical protein
MQVQKNNAPSKRILSRRREAAKVFFCCSLRALRLRENFGSRLYQHRFNVLSVRMTEPWNPPAANCNHVFGRYFGRDIYLDTGMFNDIN